MQIYLFFMRNNLYLQRFQFKNNIFMTKWNKTTTILSCFYHKASQQWLKQHL